MLLPKCGMKFHPSSNKEEEVELKKANFSFSHFFQFSLSPRQHCFSHPLAIGSLRSEWNICLDLLCFPPNEAKLSHRSLDLAYGYGHEHPLLATETKNV
jgi:hypothetical protein